MRTMLAVGLIVASLPAMAAHPSAYAPDWGGRDVAVQARHLDDAATRLYQDLRFNSHRSDLRSRARDLARATHDFRYLAERRASYPKLASGFRRVEQREDALARRLYDGRGYDRYGPAPASLRRLRHAIQRVDFALQRYAYGDRDHRHRGSFVYVPSYESWYGYGVRHDDRRHDQYDDRRHDRRDERRDDRRHDWRDDQRRDQRDGRRDDSPQDRRDDGRSDRRDDRRVEQRDPRAEQRDGRGPATPLARADDTEDRRRQREPDVQEHVP